MYCCVLKRELCRPAFDAPFYVCLVSETIGRDRTRSQRSEKASFVEDASVSDVSSMEQIMQVE